MLFDPTDGLMAAQLNQLASLANIALLNLLSILFSPNNNEHAYPLDTRANPVNFSTTIAPGCSNDELRLFAYACQRTGLDPFSKQIYAIKRGGKMTIQAGIDGLRSIAERTGQLDGSETHWCGEDGVWTDVWLAAKPPAAAKTILHRKGASHPFVGVARFADYNAGQGLWSKMPAAMIAKCSEALSLRKAFPADSAASTALMRWTKQWSR
jgi:phage recombination protein Bet